MQGISPSLAISDLELVLALAEAGSTVRAAATLHLTQSAVSRALLAVEDKLGVLLFERNARGLLPTAAGRRFVTGAGPVLAEMLALEEQVRTGTAGSPPVRVVCECYTAYRWLPGALAALHNGATIALDHTHAPVAALLAGDVDAALLTTAKVPKTLREVPLFHDEIVFVVAATHPLAERGELRVGDLAEHQMITLTSTPEPERQWFLRAVFGKARPRVRQLAFPLTEAVVDAVRAGMGIAAMSEWVARPYVASGDVVALRLERKRLQRPWRLAYRPETAVAAMQLATALRGAPPRLHA